VPQLRNAFNDMPMPPERELLKFFNMMTDERLTIENDREEMDRQRRFVHAAAIVSPSRRYGSLTPGPISFSIAAG